MTRRTRSKSWALAPASRTGASARNWNCFLGAVVLDPRRPPFFRDIVSDPQTSGGLLVAVAANSADEVMQALRAAGYAAAAVIGEIGSGLADPR